MKRNNIFYICIMAFLMSSCSCSNTQKPSDRVQIWIENTFSTDMNSSKVCVPFRRNSSGLAEIQVSLNGVPFNMIWDTGASITSISALELQNLAKQGKITCDSEFKKMNVRVADGSIVEEMVFNIDEIYIPGQDNKYIVLKNISTIVSENDEAPLLLGSNVIKNLPKHTFNESIGVIEFDK